LPSGWRPATKRAAPPDPLVDALAEAQIRPGELWADRGYASAATRAGTARAGDRAADQQTAAGGRADPGRHADARGLAGKRRRLKTRDPQPPPLAGRAHNAWLKALRRIATRRDRKAANYLAFLDWG